MDSIIMENGINNDGKNGGGYFYEKDNGYKKYKGNSNRYNFMNI
mgnify:CR=1 FL=1